MYEKRIGESTATSRKLLSSAEEKAVFEHLVERREAFSRLLGEIVALAKADKDQDALKLTTGPARDLALEIAADADKVVAINERNNFV